MGCEPVDPQEHLVGRVGGLRGGSWGGRGAGREDVGGRLVLVPSACIESHPLPLIFAGGPECEQ